MCFEIYLLLQQGLSSQQFLFEALVVGVLGGIFGALAGAGVVWFTSWSRDYVMILSLPSLIGWSLDSECRK